jgi:hypothetical protein
MNAILPLEYSIKINVFQKDLVLITLLRISIIALTVILNVNSATLVKIILVPLAIISYETFIKINVF